MKFQGSELVRTSQPPLSLHVGFMVPGTGLSDVTGVKPTQITDEFSKYCRFVLGLEDTC